MAVERTLGIVKPDAVEHQKVGEILAMVEGAGLTLKAMRMVRLSRPQAEGFYAVHRERPFFGELIEFMTRGPVVVFAMEADGAVARWRKLMGATNPAEAEDGTIRERFGTNVGENAVHGSDSPDNARIEVNYFFPGFELGT
jgi:nucleoside-diphosphate kinase